MIFWVFLKTFALNWRIKGFENDYKFISLELISLFMVENQLDCCRREEPGAKQQGQCLQLDDFYWDNIYIKIDSQLIMLEN